LSIIARWSAMDIQPTKVAQADERLQLAPGQTSTTVVPRPIWHGTQTPTT
jgi:hypothetical protein